VAGDRDFLSPVVDSIRSTNGQRRAQTPIGNGSGEGIRRGIVWNGPAAPNLASAPGSLGQPCVQASGDGDLERLLVILPPRIRHALTRAAVPGREVIELALDLGRPPVARFSTGHAVIDPLPFSQPELEAIVGQVGTFRRNNRAGIDGTLHRVSLLRDRFRAPVGLTMRIGRHLAGVVEGIRDVLLEGSQSLLLVGPPAVGKTTLLRDCARLLSERLGPAVVVVDSHNEIGGDGKIPHPAIGAARRLQVPDGCDQYEIMLEAIRNHYPEVVIVDEVTTRQEADMARTISRRGVRLIATAHGETLADVVHNPELCWLVGGIVEAEASPRRRAEPPAMEMALELTRDRTLILYRQVDRAVDAIHAHAPHGPGEVRSVMAAVQQRPKPERVRARAHELIPESDPWGVMTDSECAARAAVGVLYLLGRDVPGTLHVRTGAGVLSLTRSVGLPLAELEATASESDLFLLDPWVTLPDGTRAVVVLWTFTASPEACLKRLPDHLQPQVTIRSGVGRTLVWTLPSPYREEAPGGLPALSVFLSEIALALNAIPAGPCDGIPLPRQEADLAIHSWTGRTDPRALWEWVHLAAAHARNGDGRGDPPGSCLAHLLS